MVRATLQSGLLDELGTRIVAGRYAAGTVVRGDDWEREFDLSRTVLREALKVLESMRLIELRRKVGIIVLPESSWNVLDPQVMRWRLAGPDRQRQIHSLTQLRLGVEPLAARNAALVATDVDRVAMLYHATQLEAAGLDRDLERLDHHDTEFHRLLLSSSGNELFAALSGVVAEVLKVTGHLVHDAIPEQQTSPPRHLHTVVARAIVDADPVAAEETMRELLLEVDDQMARADEVERSQRTSPSPSARPGGTSPN